MAGKSDNSNGKKRSKSAANKPAPTKKDDAAHQSTARQRSNGRDNSGGSVHGGNADDATKQAPLKAFPEATNATKGIGRILMRKVYLDQVEAVKSLSGLAREELLRIVGQQMPPALLETAWPFVNQLEPVDLAQLAVIQGFAFHSGYSVCLGDGAEGRNLHVEYESQRATAAAAQPASSS